MYRLPWTLLHFLCCPTISQPWRRCCARRGARVCAVCSPPTRCVCVCLGRGRSPLTMETIISAITYPISCETRRQHCVAHHGATRMWKNTKCRFSDERVFDRKRLAHHICHDYCSTFCNRPAALLLLFFLLSREGANGVDDKKEVVGGEQGW